MEEAVGPVNVTRRNLRLTDARSKSSWFKSDAADWRPSRSSDWTIIYLFVVGSLLIDTDLRDWRRWCAPHSIGISSSVENHMGKGSPL